MTPGWRRELRRFTKDRAAALGMALLLLLIVVAVFAPVLAPFPGDVADFHTANRLRAPDAVNWLGTDRMGSDLLSRIMFGARITITIAFVAVGSAVMVGVPIGLLAGYYGGWPSNLLMRVSDIFLAVPQIVLAIAIAQTLGPSIENVILALSITYWPFWARLVFAETRSLKNEIFIESAIALGASPLRVMTLHVLPNIASAIIVRTSIGMGATILTAAALGFRASVRRRRRPNGAARSPKRASSCPRRGGTRPRPGSRSSSSSWASTCWATGCAISSTRASGGEPAASDGAAHGRGAVAGLRHRGRPRFGPRRSEE